MSLLLRLLCFGSSKPVRLELSPKQINHSESAVCEIRSLWTGAESGSLLEKVCLNQLIEKVWGGVGRDGGCLYHLVFQELYTLHRWCSHSTEEGVAERKGLNDRKPLTISSA